MPHAPEAVTGKTLVGFAVLAVVLGLFAAPIALWVGPTGQPMVLRIAAAFFCIVISYRLIGVIKSAALLRQQTVADITKRQRVAPPQVDPLLGELAKEIRRGIGVRVVTPALWERVQRLS